MRTAAVATAQVSHSQRVQTFNLYQDGSLSVGVVRLSNTYINLYSDTSDPEHVSGLSQRINACF